MTELFQFKKSLILAPNSIERKMNFIEIIKIFTEMSSTESCFLTKNIF